MQKLVAEANSKYRKRFASLVGLHSFGHHVTDPFGEKCRACEGRASTRKQQSINIVKDDVQLAFWGFVRNINDAGSGLLEKLNIGCSDVCVFIGGVLFEGRGLSENTNHRNFLKVLYH